MHDITTDDGSFDEDGFTPYAVGQAHRIPGGTVGYCDLCGRDDGCAGVHIMGGALRRKNPQTSDPDGDIVMCSDCVEQLATFMRSGQARHSFLAE